MTRIAKVGPNIIRNCWKPRRKEVAQLGWWSQGTYFFTGF